MSVGTAVAVIAYISQVFTPLESIGMEIETIPVSYTHLHVTFDGGEGTALDVDEEGRLVVQGAEGSTEVFTGEVCVHVFYGAV